MASPAWLPQEVQSSTSQDLASSPPTGESSVGTSSVGVPPIGSSSSVECPVIESPTLEGAIGARPDSTQDAARATFVNAPGYVLPPPSFSYKMPLNVNTTCGNSQLPSSSPVIKSNSTCSSSMLQPPVPSLSPGSAPSFSYNIARANVGFPGPPQFHPTMQNGSESSAPSVSQSSHTTSSSAIAVPSTPNLHPATPWMPTASSPQVPPVMSGTPAIRAPPEMASSVSIPSDVNVSSAYVGSSSAFLRPIVPAVPLPPNPGVQQQVYYASVPPMVAPPQGQWLRPPAVGGLPRPQFLTYPASFPVSFAPCDRAGMPLPSVALPDCQPPGVVPIGVPGRTPICSVSASNQSPVSSGMQPEVPPGVGNSKHIHNVDINHGVAGTEQQDAWTAHRTQTGAIYYYNALTGQSTYEKPAGFKGEPDKVAAQPTPVLCERLGGTDWEVITTNDGKKYYHNTKTKLTSWQIPSEVTELKKKQDGDSSKEQPMSVSNTNLLTEKGTAPITSSVPAVNTGGRDATTLRASGQPNSSSALDLIKKKLQESGYTPSSPIPALSVPLTSELLGPRATEPTVKTPQSENSKDKAKVANGEGNLSDSSSDSEDVDSGPTKEECIKQFKEMLKERGVAPFSKWEKELPKIVFDPRFKAIPSHSARRSLFDHYVRTRAEEERKEKRAAQKAAIEGFKQLLEEAKEDINHNTDYQSFKKKWGHDLRFEALDRKERETLLNERVFPLKKAEHERAQAMHAAAASSFKSMLQDKGNITTSSRWSKVKDGLRHDPRYKSVKHEDREALFNEYVSELKVAEEEAERAEKAKRGEEEKLKERERSLRKRKEREEQEVERVRSKARRKEAVESYQALLVEIIKDPQASWTDSKPKLEKDPQGRAANPSLDQSDLEKLFREHVKILHERCANDFRALLAEAITPESGAQETEEGKTAITSWSTAKHVLKDDPRYAKMPKKNREALWRRHVEEMQRRHAESRSRSSVDSGKHISGSKRTHERR